MEQNQFESSRIKKTIRGREPEKVLKTGFQDSGFPEEIQFKAINSGLGLNQTTPTEKLRAAPKAPAKRPMPQPKNAPFASPNLQKPIEPAPKELQPEPAPMADNFVPPVYEQNMPSVEPSFPEPSIPEPSFTQASIPTARPMAKAPVPRVEMNDLEKIVMEESGRQDYEHASGSRRAMAFGLDVFFIIAATGPVLFYGSQRGGGPTLLSWFEYSMNGSHWRLFHNFGEIGAVLLGLTLITSFLSQWAIGKTLGMWALGIRVAKAKDQSVRGIGLFRSLIRQVMFLVSAFPMGLGLLWAALDRKARTCQDLFSQTVVVIDEAEEEILESLEPSL